MVNSYIFDFYVDNNTVSISPKKINIYKLSLKKTKKFSDFRMLIFPIKIYHALSDSEKEIFLYYLQKKFSYFECIKNTVYFFR